MYGLDLLRILSMIGIIGLHIMNNGGMLAAANTIPKLLMIRIAAVICYSSVNIFAMMTGYLYVQRKTVSSANLINLIFTVGFYCIVILAGFVVVKPEVFDGFRGLYIHALFPPLVGRYWYITSYVLLFAMIPYLNALIHSLHAYQYRSMLWILFIFLSVVSTFGLNDYFKIDNGYSPFWLMFCYMVGGYIKLYEEHLFHGNLAKWIAIIVVNILLVIDLWYILGDSVISTTFLIRNYISPFIVAEAAMLLLVFSKITIRSETLKRIVLSLSNSSFGVYTLHSHILIFDYVLAGAFLWTSESGAPAFLCTLIVSPVLIYCVCWVADILRSHFFQWVRIDKFANLIGAGMDRLVGWTQE